MVFGNVPHSIPEVSVDYKYPTHSMLIGILLDGAPQQLRKSKVPHAVCLLVAPSHKKLTVEVHNRLGLKGELSIEQKYPRGTTLTVPHPLPPGVFYRKDLTLDHQIKLVIKLEEGGSTHCLTIILERMMDVADEDVSTVIVVQASASK
jgi:hypothetical protein